MKENKLKQAMLGMKDVTPAPPPVQPEQADPLPKKEKIPIPPSRQGKKGITGFFAPAAAKQFKLMAVESESTVQSLLEEALNDLFKKYGKSPIA